MKELLIPKSENYSVETTEFYLRELKLKVRIEDNTTKEPLAVDSLIYCHDIKLWESRLLKSKDKSISIFLFGNEYYDIQKYTDLNAYKAIKAAYIEIIPLQRQRTQYLALLRCVWQHRVYWLERAYWATIKNAAHVDRSLRRLRFNIPVFRLPLGYSNRFVKELKDIGIVKTVSDSLFNMDFNQLGLTRNGISFFGQKGSWYRRTMIKFFEGISNSNIEKYGSWGGHSNLPNTTEYVDSILRSEFVICPPGNRTSQTWRYYEAICLGAIPIITEVSLQDWSYHGYWPKECDFSRKTYKQVWGKLSRMDERTRAIWQNQFREQILKEFTELKMLLNDKV